MFTNTHIALERGFDAYYGYLGGAEDYWTHYSGPAVDFFDGYVSVHISVYVSTRSMHMFSLQKCAMISECDALLTTGETQSPTHRAPPIQAILQTLARWNITLLIYLLSARSKKLNSQGNLVPHLCFCIWLIKACIHRTRHHST